MKSMIKNRSMVNHSIFSRGIKYDDMNILTWTILKKTQILNGCETFALKYIYSLYIFGISFISTHIVIYWSAISHMQRVPFRHGSNRARTFQIHKVWTNAYDETNIRYEVVVR